MLHKCFTRSFIFFIIILLLEACSGTQQGDSLPSDKLEVLATTTIVGDVVSAVGGEQIQLSVLLPTGSDPHSFEPAPQDLARLEGADLIFANGAGLEEFLERLIDSAGGQDKLVSLSDGFELLDTQIEDQGAQDADEHAGGDPHVWTDPSLVAAWVERIAQALGERDPSNAETYRENAAAYQGQLRELDTWIQEQVALVPPQDRKLVTDHKTFAYFARRYGFETVGAVIPSYSTLAEPSAQEMAALEDAIRSLGVAAIFVDHSVNPGSAQRVAQDTGVRLVPVYSASLSEAGGEAGTYLDFMRYNTSAIVNALK